MALQAERSSIEKHPLIHRGRCRFCGSSLRHTFADLGMSPLCESYLSLDQLNRMEPFYPLRVYVCEHCYLVQLEEFVSPVEIFSEYAYFSSYSETWLQHAAAYTDMIAERLQLGPRSSVVELASNDGYLLQYFVRKGIPALGIEPAANVAKVAIEKGVPTLVSFFGAQLARKLVAEGRRADLLIGNNVLAQVPDLNDFVGGMKLLLGLGGVITIEFPHLMQLIAENQFDTIYHEHFSYFSYIAVEKIFAAHGLTVFDVEELPTHGGSLRIYARHAQDAGEPISLRALELKSREEAAGYTRMETYAAFQEQVMETKRKLLEFLISVKRQPGKGEFEGVAPSRPTLHHEPGAVPSGKGEFEGVAPSRPTLHHEPGAKQNISIVGYGAPGKGNTLLNYCGIRTDFLDYTVDRNPYKQGKFLPGTHIPILHPETIRATKPEYVLILPWNFKDEIMRQMSYIREWGGRFVVPIPEVRVY